MTEPPSDPDDRTTGRETGSEDIDGVTLPHGSSTWKVLGETDVADGIGVLGHSTATSGVATGVRGAVGSVGAGTAGVSGGATGGSGRTYGVHGETRSTDAGAAGVRGTAPGGGAAAVRAEGHVSISEVGLSAYLASPQSVPDFSRTAVEFDSFDRDDFGGLDTSTGEYTVRRAGDYHVSTAIEWQYRLAGGTRHDVYVEVNGSDAVRRLQGVPGAASESTYVHDHLSKTLYGLDSNDVVAVSVYQDSGSSTDVGDQKADTYLTIDKVG